MAGVAPGAPWAGADPAVIVLIVSTQRGASTELAELVGNHPCGASFNELLQHAHFPSGYDKYDHKCVRAEYHEGVVNASLPTWAWQMQCTYRQFLNVSSLRKSHWLDDAREVRARFCASRPAQVATVCGDTCVVSLKMHLNNYVERVSDPDWVRLVTARDVRAVVVQRNASENYCSIRRAIASHDWGHVPAAHKHPYNASNTPCNLSSDKARDFVATVPKRFDATRAALAAAGRPFLELPFPEYIANTSRAAARVYAFSGLRQPPPKWQGACCLPWCKRCNWPMSSGNDTYP